jgi:hypothetical protein
MNPIAQKYAALIRARIEELSERDHGAAASFTIKDDEVADCVLRAAAAIIEESKAYEAMSQAVDVGQEFYDMDMGPNGSAALDDLTKSMEYIKNLRKNQ